jgi:hypothetical protein
MMISRTLFAFMLCAASHLTHAATVTCTAVDKSASVSADASISTTSSKEGKTCSFSVGGAATGRQPEVSRGFDFLRNRQNFWPNNGEQLLHLLMAAAPPSMSIPSQWGNTLNSRLSAIDQCIYEFRRGAESTFSSGDVSCQVHRPSGSSSQNAETRSTSGVTVSSPTRVLIITYRSGSTYHELFIPQNASILR